MIHPVAAARNRGYEGDNKQWGKLPRDSGIVAKKGVGKKLFYFCDFFFCKIYFCVRHESNNLFFLRTTTPCATL